VPGLDVGGLARWLTEVRPDLMDRPLHATLLVGGRSNLTYRIDGPRVPLVLRRPPLGHVLATAHDMRREHRVISALQDSPVPVPLVVGYTDDTIAAQVTGTPFFVMTHVAGRVLADPDDNQGFSPQDLHGVSIELAETLAQLHTLEPESLGLGDFGRAAGYLERQLSTWGRQYEASRSRELPALDALQARLGRGMPRTADVRPTIVHGDYRLDNTIIAVEGGPLRIAAVIDWEMATVGDPLVDLGLLGLYWDVSALPQEAASLARGSVDPAAGYPDFAELVDAYAARVGSRVPDLSWYRAFAAYKLAVVIEQIHYRHGSGQTVGEGLGRLGDLAEPIAREGLAWAAHAEE